MKFQLPSLIIDDSNASQFAREVSNGTMAAGYVERDYSRYGFGTYAAKYSGSIIPRREWPRLIELQERNQSSPWHVHKANKVPVLDQNGYGYCWMYGAVAGMMNRYAAQGLAVPHLSAAAPAFQGKNWRNQGGWAGEAIEYIDRFGVPTVDTWPEHKEDRSLVNDHAQQLDAKRHGVVEFEELPAQSFDAVCSCLLDPIDPCPCTAGLMWWGHLVCFLRVILVNGKFQIVFVNSWKPTWGDNGYGILSESKATPHEAIRIKRVKPRAA